MKSERLSMSLTNGVRFKFYLGTTRGILMPENMTPFSITGLVAQQPIGVPAEGWKAHEKDFKPLAETVRVLH